MDERQRTALVGMDREVGRTSRRQCNGWQHPSLSCRTWPYAWDVRRSKSQIVGFRRLRRPLLTAHKGGDRSSMLISPIHNVEISFFVAWQAPPLRLGFAEPPLPHAARRGEESPAARSAPFLFPTQWGRGGSAKPRRRGGPVVRGMFTCREWPPGYRAGKCESDSLEGEMSGRTEGGAGAMVIHQ